MIVQPTLPDHPKYRRLKKRIGDKAAEMLLRLWAHCQGNKRGEFWPNKTAGYVEDIAGWDGEEGKLATALQEPCGNGPGWITIEKDGIRINGWNEHNATLLVRWNANPSGKSKAGSQETLKGSHSPPSRLPDRIGKDRSGEEGTRARGASPVENSDEKRAGGENSPPSVLPDGHNPSPPGEGDPHIPSLEEVTTQGQMPGWGVPEEYCRHFYETHENDQLWLNGHKVLKDWRKRLKGWWEKDRDGWSKKRRGKKSREDVADLEAQLQLAQEPAQIEQLRKRLEEARA